MDPTPEPTASSETPAPGAGGCSCGRSGPRPPSGHPVAVVGVRLRGQVRMTQVNAQDLDLELGETVLVEGERGQELGEVVQATTRARRSCAISCMKSVVRQASAEDVAVHDASRALEETAFAWCRERIRERNLPMRLVSVEETIESHKLTFQFTAEGRVDFRDLVRDLAQHLHVRIEMRQIGVRDEAAIDGGYGPCGKALCCSTFLKGFAPISIKMAKEQKLSLNPSKLSGMCGRLKCCLRYEYETAGGDAPLAPEDEPLPPAPDGTGPAATAPPA